jgi:hypothetical protein
LFFSEYGPSLLAVKDVTLKRLYARNLAELLDVDIREIEQSVRTDQLANSAQGTHPANSASHAKPQPQAHSGATNPKVAVPAAESTSERRIFDLSKASRIELEFLNVILLKEVYLKEAIKADVVASLTNPGVKSLFVKIVELYGQMPSKFDNLTASLADEVKPVGAITRHLDEFYTSLNDEAATKLLRDCMNRIGENYKRNQIKELMLDLRVQGQISSQEQLEQIMNIQKSRRSKAKDS